MNVSNVKHLTKRLKYQTNANLPWTSHFLSFLSCFLNILFYFNSRFIYFLIALTLLMLSSKYVGWSIMLIVNIFIIYSIAMILIYPWLDTTQGIGHTLFKSIHSIDFFFIFPACVLFMILFVIALYLGALFLSHSDLPSPNYHAKHLTLPQSLSPHHEWNKKQAELR